MLICNVLTYPGAVAAASETESTRKSTRQWVEDNEYNPDKILHKMFHDDIKYLLTMDKLWKSRKPPVPLDLSQLQGAGEGNNNGTYALKDQRPWSIQECVHVFRESVRSLSQEYKSSGYLTWDKDDKPAMDFVTATANIRASIFSIEQKSRFDVKSMAGNIIPAIATTNAIIAGQIVLEGMKILRDDWAKCTMSILQRRPTNRRKLIVPSPLEKPRESCYACAEKPEVTVSLNTETMTVGGFEEKVLKKHLGMVAPDVEIEDGKGTIIISSEEGETTENNEKTLSHFGVTNHTRLKCDDFLQEYELVVTILHNTVLSESRENPVEFTVSGSAAPAPAPLPAASAVETAKAVNEVSTSNSLTPRKRNREEIEIEDNDDLVVL